MFNLTIIFKKVCHKASEARCFCLIEHETLINWFKVSTIGSINSKNDIKLKVKEYYFVVDLYT